MKEIIRQYLDGGVSRRQFLNALGAVGLAATAADSMASSLAPFQAPEDEGEPKQSPPWMKRMRGTGGALLVAQLKAAGTQYIFFNPGTGESPIFDALVDEPDIHPIKILQEGSVASMADGYARASGKTPVVVVAFQGLSNCMSGMRNSFLDSIPMVVMSNSSGENVTDPFTKWHWAAERAQTLPAVVRQAFKFASTPPCAPVFVGLSGNALNGEAEAEIMDQSKFTLSMEIQPDPALVDKAARLLLEARNPLLFAGDEIALSGAQKEVLELAELLALPVTKWLRISGWSRTFPTRNPLYLGEYQNELRYPGEIDVMLNLGGRFPLAVATGKIPKGLKLIHAGIDPSHLATGFPTEVAILANVKLTTAALVSAIRSMATPARLQQIRDSRYEKTKEFTSKMRDFRRSIGKSVWDQSPMSLDRLGMELEENLDKDTCVVAEPEPGRDPMHNQMDFGGDDKQWFSNGGITLGWALGASCGIKLALPDRPVVAITGDGAFLFSGPQALWTFSRYRVPVTIIVVNNRSYNTERNRMWAFGGRMFQAGMDMACYLGDPDIDYSKLAGGLGVEGEVVQEPSSFREALSRAKRANADGRPYLLDVHVARAGIGSTSSWHPPYSVAALRQRKV